MYHTWSTEADQLEEGLIEERSWWSGRRRDKRRVFFCTSKVTAERVKSCEKRSFKVCLKVDGGEERGDDGGRLWPPASGRDTLTEENKQQGLGEAGGRLCLPLAAQHADRCCHLCLKWSFQCCIPILIIFKDFMDSQRLKNQWNSYLEYYFFLFDLLCFFWNTKQSLLL